MKSLHALLVLALSLIILPTAQAVESAAEKAIYEQIDRESEIILDLLIEKAELGSPTRMQRVRTTVFVKFKQLGALKNSLAKYGPKVIGAYMATEAVTNFILIPTLIATGQAHLVPVVIATPAGTPASIAVILWDRYKIKKAMGVPSLQVLDKLRNEILDYGVKERLFETLLAAADSGLDADYKIVLAQNASKHSTTAALSQVTLKEMQGVIRQAPQGKSFLLHAEQYRPKKEVYAFLLLKYIQNDSQLMNSFTEKYRGRFISMNETETKAQTFLRENDELLKEIRTQLVDAAKAQKETKALKPQAIDAADLNLLNTAKKQIKTDLEALNYLQQELQKLDYSYLESYRLGKRRDLFFAEGKIALHKEIKAKIETTRTTITALRNERWDKTLSAVISRPKNCGAWFMDIH